MVDNPRLSVNVSHLAALAIVVGLVHNHDDGGGPATVLK